jgi:hypothetical protein
MPRYFSATWLIYVIFCVVSAIIEFGYDAIMFLFPIVLSGFFVALLATLIVARVARLMDSKHDPFHSRFDWTDE